MNHSYRRQRIVRNESGAFLVDPSYGFVQIEDYGSMSSPVRCTHCGNVYDVGKVTVTARYSDCSVWKSPCCNLTVDDRPAGWKSAPDIEWLR